LKIFYGIEGIRKALSGWSFETIIHHYLKNELLDRGILDEIETQYKLHGRKRIDLKISNIIIEIKTQGIFGKKAVENYSNHKRIATEKCQNYLYIATEDTDYKVKQETINFFGEENAFFLSDEGSWQKFVERVSGILKQK